MAKQLGVKRIEMYVSMITKEFQPLLDEVAYLEKQDQDAVRDKAAKNVGLYDIMADIKKCEAKLELLNSEKRRMTCKGWGDDENFSDNSPMGMEIRRLSRINPSVGRQVRCALEQAVKNVKLCGVADDVRDIFERTEKTIADLSNMVKGLPRRKAAKHIK